MKLDHKGSDRRVEVEVPTVLSYRTNPSSNLIFIRVRNPLRSPSQVFEDDIDPFGGPNRTGPLNTDYKTSIINYIVVFIECSWGLTYYLLYFRTSSRVCVDEVVNINLPLESVTPSC